MKYTLKQIAFLLVIINILFSCSIEKRRYMTGYHVSSHKKTNTTAKPSQTKQPKTENKILESDEVLVASLDNSITLPKGKKSLIYSNPKEECDIIILKNSDEIKAKIVEITETEIKYKKCNDSDGKIYTYKKSEVFMVKYPNGSKEVIKAPVESNSDPNVYESKPQDKLPVQKEVEKTVNPFSLVGFIFSILGLFALVYAVIKALAIFSMFFYTGVWIIPFILTAILCVIGLIFSIVGLSQTKKKPEKYSGKVFAVLGLILSLIVVGLIGGFFGIYF
ncbi:MAG: DUF4190 domain-containing protein [Bacteroidia bacterium]|nr:DUF4190 domain-containing protein [Bacteroidia bacterium]